LPFDAKRVQLKICSPTFPSFAGTVNIYPANKTTNLVVSIENTSLWSIGTPDLERSRQLGQMIGDSKNRSTFLSKEESKALTESLCMGDIISLAPAFEGRKIDLTLCQSAILVAPPSTSKKPPYFFLVPDSEWWENWWSWVRQSNELGEDELEHVVRGGNLMWSSDSPPHIRYLHTPWDVLRKLCEGPPDGVGHCPFQCSLLKCEQTQEPTQADDLKMRQPKKRKKGLTSQKTTTTLKRKNETPKTTNVGQNVGKALGVFLASILQKDTTPISSMLQQNALSPSLESFLSSLPQTIQNEQEKTKAMQLRIQKLEATMEIIKFNRAPPPETLGLLSKTQIEEWIDDDVETNA
jgi:hypothetical protein